MALKLRLRPDERLALNGAVLRNATARAIEIEILNEATLLHERDIMLPDQADEPLKQLYMLVQAMHLGEGDADDLRARFTALASELAATAVRQENYAECNLIVGLVGKIGERDYIGAMKIMRGEFGRPGDERKARAHQEE